MRVRFHRNFVKRYKVLKKLRKRIDERITLFMEDPFNPILNNHSLQGEYKHCRSINITGDVRALYELTAQDTATFIALGSHDELYDS